MNKLYRIEEYCTNGWATISPDATKLTREQCDDMLRRYMEIGYNPNRMRAVLDK